MVTRRTRKSPSGPLFGQKWTLLVQILHKTHHLRLNWSHWVLLRPLRRHNNGVIMDMVRKLKSEISLITLDNDKIRTVCEKLLYDNRDRDRAICDLTGLVKRSLDPSSGCLPQPNTFQPQPIIRPELIMGISGLQTSELPGQALIHSYMESRLSDRMSRSSPRDRNRPRQHHTNR